MTTTHPAWLSELNPPGGVTMPAAHAPRGMDRRGFLKAALATVVLTSQPALVRAAYARPAWADLIEVENHPSRPTVEQALDSFTFPWARMRDGLAARPPMTPAARNRGTILVRFVDDGPELWTPSTAVVSVRSGRTVGSYRRSLAHELGHAVDTYLLSPSRRREVTEFLHPGCGHTWLSRGFPHDERVGERYATLAAEVFGGRYVDHGIAAHYGPGEKDARRAGRRPDRTLDTIATLTLMEDDMATTTTTQRFRDVDPNDVHGGNINDLAAAGVVTGYDDGTFRGGDSVTRAQVASFLARALDVAVPGWR